jgi:hypothetical protein
MNLGEMRNAHNILVGNVRGSYHFVIMGGYEDNFRMDLKGIGHQAVDWICLSQDRVTVAGFCEHYS